METTLVARPANLVRRIGQLPITRPQPIQAREWTSAEGVVVTIRPIGAGDLDLEKDFVRRLSAFTSYQRLMSPRMPTEQELRRWTDVDGVREVGLIAVVPEGHGQRQIGVARYVVEQIPTEAEFAVVLSDDWQGRGLGRQLLARLVEVARARGLERLIGTTLSENGAMLSLGRKLGFKTRMVMGAATITSMTLQLDATSPS
jgi:GNAT superfamily N-acetyltransferase